MVPLSSSLAGNKMSSESEVTLERLLVVVLKMCLWLPVWTYIRARGISCVFCPLHQGPTGGLRVPFLTETDRWISHSTREDCYIRDPTNGFPVCHIGEDFLDVTSVTSSGTKWWTSCPCITVQADLSSLSHELLRPCFGWLLGSIRKFGPDTEVTPPSGASSRVHGF